MRLLTKHDAIILQFLVAVLHNFMCSGHSHGMRQKETDVYLFYIFSRSILNVSFQNLILGH